MSDQCCICRGAVFLGGDQHFQRVNHVPQSCAGPVWLEDPQSVMWVSADITCLVSVFSFVWRTFCCPALKGQFTTGQVSDSQLQTK